MKLKRKLFGEWESGSAERLKTRLSELHGERKKHTSALFHWESWFLRLLISSSAAFLRRVSFWSIFFSSTTSSKADKFCALHFTITLPWGKRPENIENSEGLSKGFFIKWACWFSISWFEPFICSSIVLSVSNIAPLVGYLANSLL